MAMVDDEAVETNTQRHKIDKNNIPIKFHIRSRACVWNAVMMMVVWHSNNETISLILIHNESECENRPKTDSLNRLQALELESDDYSHVRCMD